MVKRRSYVRFGKTNGSYEASAFVGLVTVGCLRRLGPVGSTSVRGNYWPKDRAGCSPPLLDFEPSGQNIVQSSPRSQIAIGDVMSSKGAASALEPGRSTSAKLAQYCEHWLLTNPALECRETQDTSTHFPSAPAMLLRTLLSALVQQILLTEIRFLCVGRSLMREGAAFSRWGRVDVPFRSANGIAVSSPSRFTVNGANNDGRTQTTERGGRRDPVP